MFDFSFDNFVAADLIKVIYAGSMLVLAIGWIIGLVSGNFGLYEGLVAAVGSFLLLVVIRVACESAIVIFRISEHLSELVRLQRGPAGN